MFIIHKVRRIENWYGLVQDVPYRINGTPVQEAPSHKPPQIKPNQMLWFGTVQFDSVRWFGVGSVSSSSVWS